MHGQPAQSPASSVRGLALGALLEEGLPGWLQTIATALDATPVAVARTATTNGAQPFSAQRTAHHASSLVPPARQQEIAMVLANLVLSRKHLTPPIGRIGPGGTRC